MDRCYFTALKALHTKIQISIDSSRKNNPERVSVVWLEAHTDEAGSAWVDTIRVVTNGDLLLVEPSERLKYNKSYELKAARPKSSDDWDLKGLYGLFDLTQKAFARLSPVWGRAVADDPAPKAMPLFEPGRLGHLGLSHPHGGLTNTAGKLFNALDYIDESWVISKADFYLNNVGDISVLSGIAVECTNDKQLQHDRRTGGTGERRAGKDSAAAKELAATSNPPTVAAEPAETPGPTQSPPIKEKAAKKSDLWFSGPLGHREHTFWDLKAASVSPSQDRPSGTWAIKGFMG
ncbi:hypothetical protein ANO14919_029850 [Xylariales sp. No.14919]|nr:hypothetical protein ANO14919_029850 [Xylariales sp. No.14919]